MSRISSSGNFDTDKPNRVSVGDIFLRAGKAGDHGTKKFFAGISITASHSRRPAAGPGNRQRLFFLPTVSLVNLLASLHTMAIWDSLSGRKEPQGEAMGQPAMAQDASSILADMAIPDPTQLHPLSGVNQDTLDYITLEDSTLDQLPGSRSVLPSRGWSDDLCYGTGTTYLAALTAGGVMGLSEGLRRTPMTAPPKIRLNSVLNSVTRHGPWLGNMAGVVALVYNGLNSMIGAARGKHDAANSVAAGALSGMMFRSTAGIRNMMISGGMVASIAGGWAVGLSIVAFKPYAHMLQVVRKAFL